MKRQEGEQLVRELKEKGLLKNPKTLEALSDSIATYIKDQVKKNSSNNARLLFF
ncbi:MAG: hypothetical protein R2786_07455 [Flavobacteriaceae bacterium]